MTSADDCSFSIGDESAWRFVGATDQSPFSKWLFRHSALCLTFPLVDLFLEREVEREPNAAWPGQPFCREADRVVSGLLDCLASHYRPF